MANNERLTNSLSKSEALLGWVYLIFEVLFLPTLLVLVNTVLHRPLDLPWINFVYFCVNFLAVAMIFRKFLKKSLSDLFRNPLRVLKGAFLGFCVHYVSNLAMTELMGLLFPGFSNVNDQNVSSLLQLDYYPMLIGTVVLAPFAEEVLFRGAVFQSLYTKNRFLGYLISVGLFCAVHVLGYVRTADPMTLALCFVQYIPASVCLAWAYTQSDNIFAPILIHTAVNAMGVMAVR